MIRRPLRPSFPTSETPMLLEALGVARRWSVKYGSCHPYGSEPHTKCYALAKAIDDVGIELTGDPEYFQTKWASYLPSPPKS
jgi:hypothetical protein